MNESEVKGKLCHYDKRNPNSIYSYMSEDDIKEDGYKPNLEGCYCDNCFYGRTKLALYILELKEKEGK